MDATANGNVITLNFDEYLDYESIPYISGFSVYVNNALVLVDDLQMYHDIIDLCVSLDTPIQSTDIMTISYKAGANPIQDQFGNKAGDVSEKEVINNTLASDIYEADERYVDDTTGNITDNYYAINITTDGTHQTHTLAPAGDVDWVYFTGTAGVTYTIQTLNLNPGGMDTVMTLHFEDGTDPVYNDDSGDGLASYITFTAQYTGDYFIEVQHYDGYSAGYYDISVTSNEQQMMTVQAPDAAEEAVTDKANNVPVKVNFPTTWQTPSPKQSN